CLASTVQRRSFATKGGPTMYKPALLVAVAGLIVSPVAASAKGCLKGAAVGAVAGHVAGHHGKAGAAAGCAIGHHKAAKAAKRKGK
ncbi:MAG TPA: hypothetical protein VE968_07575, partial [Sphingomicrobium sp.]|nr:hypothetical protein [Sphingomicrobium sp.]